MDELDWNVLDECKLFEAMVDHKPVGVNKYFQMALLWNKLQDFLGKDISSEKIWFHLSSMYNMESLDEIESIPFPNDEREFYLPEGEFGSLKIKKEEKPDDRNKTNAFKKTESKDPPKVTQKEIRKDDKTPAKKEMPRRDSKDGKDVKNPLNFKKDVRKELESSKSKPFKGKTPVKEDDKIKTPKLDDANKRQNKRPTRGSMRPEDSKSQSPLTVIPTSANKRRRI